jgi:fructokinase
MSSISPLVVCFGEILWDNLPTGRNPGGAPMNVAYHLNKLGLQAALISAVGVDKPGDDLLQFLADKGVLADYIQRDHLHQTSEVVASVNEDHEVSYKIITDVAWDYIQQDSKSQDAVAQASAFVYGSLGARNAVSRATLLNLLEHSSYNVFDVNLRAPHYTPELVQQLLAYANLLKVNAAELEHLATWNQVNATSEEAIVSDLFSRYKMEAVVITKGSSGASFYTREKSFHSKTYQVDVKDTIGSGDSFLAALLAMRLSNESNDVALDTAVAMGAFITSKAGACPQYETTEFNDFKAAHKDFG